MKIAPLALSVQYESARNVEVISFDFILLTYLFIVQLILSLQAPLLNVTVNESIHQFSIFFS